jgi:hypothetical protein
MKALVGYKLSHVLHGFRAKTFKELKFPATKDGHFMEFQPNSPLNITPPKCLPLIPHFTKKIL